MKILHVIPSVDESKGGPTRAVLDMAQALTQQGVFNRIIACNIDPSQISNYSGAELIGFKSAGGERWGFSPALGKWLSTNAGQYDGLHLHSFFSYTTLAGADAAVKSQVPYVIRPAGALDRFSIRQKYFKKQLFMLYRGKRLLKNAGAVHCTSEFEAEQIRQRDCGANITVIPIGTFVTEALGRKVNDQTLTLIYLGRIYPHKGIELLFEAMSQLKKRGHEITLVLAGGGEASFVNQLKSFAHSLNISNRILWVGSLVESEKIKWFSKSDVLVLASEHENFGISSLEAMAAGLPVIVSDQVGIADQIRKSNAGLVIKNTVTQLISAVEHFLSHPSDINRIGSNGKTLVEQQFRWPKIAKQLIALYESLKRTK